MHTIAALRWSLLGIVVLMLSVSGCGKEEVEEKPKVEKKAKKKAKKAKKAEPCARSFSAHKGDKKKGFTCSCPAEKPKGTVWGDGIYTTDSSICGAAIHVGAIKADKGGNVEVEPTDGCRSYAGKNQNGISAKSWGSWGGSFYIKGHGTKKCADVCPRAWSSIGGLTENSELACKCPPKPSKGTVWGSGIYTTDSDVCSAAIHAGVIEASKGGEIKAKATKGCGAYTGSEANGITSSKWGKWDKSFYFPSKGKATCE